MYNFITDQYSNRGYDNDSNYYDNEYDNYYGCDNYYDSEDRTDDEYID